MVPIIPGGLANGVLVQYEDWKMCAYNMYLPAVYLKSNSGTQKAADVLPSGVLDASVYI